jgi:CDP-paratose 2-epimerase
MSASKPVLITGGAGFIGTNVAHRFLQAGRNVVLFDSLARAGVEHNARWLREQHGSRVHLEQGDIRDAEAVRRVVAEAGEIYHFAAQVAVTTSLLSPVEDFEVNARGTLNVLEAMRSLDKPPPLLFTSTNKVYGGLEDLSLRTRGGRYEPCDDGVRAHGVGEERTLDFHSPYGCSKGAADQYVIDYARTTGLQTVVFRMSCIYGPHQFGTEDQGWVAHFLLRALENRPISIYGDGMQVRDVLFVDDLVDAMLLARENIHRLAGQAFNIGGGPGHTLSLLELTEQIGALEGRMPTVEFGSWRTGDQRYYVSDTRKFQRATGWVPRMDAADGVRALHAWLRASRGPAAAQGAKAR